MKNLFVRSVSFDKTPFASGGPARPHRGWVLAIPLLLAAMALAAPAQVSIWTRDVDNQRTGANTNETILTPSNVNTNQFGLLFKKTVDNQVYTTPLVIANVSISGGTHNVVYVGTVNNTLYAFDADSGTQYWSTNFGNAPSSSDAGEGTCVDINSKWGICGTPVVDTNSGTLYVVAQTYIGGVFNQQLHAINIGTGAEKFGGPVTISASGFTPQKQNQRPALLLLGGLVYIAWGSHCDLGPYEGFIMGYNASTLAQTTVLNISPGSGNGSIWQAGCGPAVDSSSNIYVMTANGIWDGSSSFGESFVKLSTSGGILSVVDYFTPNNYAAYNSADLDLGASGPVVIPGTTDVIGGGKIGSGSDSGNVANDGAWIYVLNMTNMGHMHTPDTAGARQIFQATVVPNGSYYMHIHGSPVFWNSGLNGPAIFVWGENDFARAYKLSGSTFVTNAFSVGSANSPANFNNGMPGAMLFISANGNTNGILWANAILSGNANQSTVPGVLRAYNANNLSTELWDSQTLSSRDGSDNFGKYSTPVAVNGKVYVSGFGTGTTNTGELLIYGLLSSTNQVAEPSFNPGGGTYNSAQSVTISTTTSGATIRYTIDGSTPSETQGTVYSSAVSIPTNTTLKAIAYKSGMTDSAINSTTYTIQVVAPTFSPGGGIYTNAQSVTISTTTGGATIRYTIDGSTPSETQGTVYTSAVSITNTTTLKAIAYKVNWADSSVTSGSYIIGSGGGGIAFTSTFPAPNPPSGVTLYGNASILSAGGLQLNPATQGTSGAAVISNLDVGSGVQSFSLSAGVTTTNGAGNNPADGFGIYFSAPGVVPVGSYQNYEALGVGSGLAMLVGEFAGTISIETSNTTFSLTLPSRSALVGNISATFSYDPVNGAALTLTGSDNTNYTVSASAAQLAADGLSFQSGYLFTLGGRTGYPGTTNADSHTINSLTIITNGGSGGGQVAAPSFNPGGGTYSSAQSVTISTATGGATIRYTTDGSTPSESNGTVYSSAVNISSTTTLKAIAYKSGMTDSSVTSATYTISGGGGANTVSLNFNTAGQYTTNFSNPGGGSPCTETNAGGVTNSGALLVTGGDSNATYTNASWNFSTNTASIAASLMIQIQQAAVASGKIQLGFVNNTTAGFALAVSGDGWNFGSFRLLPQSTSTPSYQLAYQTATNGYTVGANVGSTFTLTAGHWYQFNTYFTNTSPGASYNMAASLIDYGTTGATAGTNMFTFSTLQSATGTNAVLSSDSSVWPCFRLATNTTGAKILDNFTAQ